MVRQDPSAAIDARPTCVPTCSLLMVVVATSVVSATVSVKVQCYVKKTICHPKPFKQPERETSTFKIIKLLNLIERKQVNNLEYTGYGSTFSFISLSYPSASLLLPTS